MDTRLLSAPSARDRRGRRAGDTAPIHTATFIAQVAGLCLPEDRATAAYPSQKKQPPAGLFRNWKV